MMLRDACAAHGLAAVALRYFNAAGGDAAGEIGEEHDPETHLIPLVLQAALGQRPHIDVLGTDYPTPDGTAVRDYIHVQDLADAHVKALDLLLKGGLSITVNLGTGTGHSVREVIAVAERVTGRRVPRREAPRRFGDPPVLVADASRAGELLGWKPALSDLDMILKTAWAWHSRGTKARRHGGDKNERGRSSPAAVAVRERGGPGAHPRARQVLLRRRREVLREGRDLRPVPGRFSRQTVS
jgi:UDP-glucose 4-epimerase